MRAPISVVIPTLNAESALTRLPAHRPRKGLDAVLFAS